MGASGVEDLIKVRILLDDDRNFQIEASMMDENRVEMLLFLVRNVTYLLGVPMRFLR